LGVLLWKDPFNPNVVALVDSDRQPGRLVDDRRRILRRTIGKHIVADENRCQPYRSAMRLNVL
jgi:hypothetical protein